MLNTICELQTTHDLNTFFSQEAEATFAAEDSTDDSSTLSRMVILAPSVQRWSFPVEPQGASQERVASAEIKLMNDKIMK